MISHANVIKNPEFNVNMNREIHHVEHARQMTHSRLLLQTDEIFNDLRFYFEWLIKVFPIHIGSFTYSCYDVSILEKLLDHFELNNITFFIRILMNDHYLKVDQPFYYEMLIATGYYSEEVDSLFKTIYKERVEKYYNGAKLLTDRQYDKLNSK